MRVLLIYHQPAIKLGRTGTIIKFPGYIFQYQFQNLGKQALPFGPAQDNVFFVQCVLISRLQNNKYLVIDFRRDLFVYPLFQVVIRARDLLIAKRICHIALLSISSRSGWSSASSREHRVSKMILVSSRLDTPLRGTRPPECFIFSSSTTSTTCLSTSS